MMEVYLTRDRRGREPYVLWTSNRHLSLQPDGVWITLSNDLSILQNITTKTIRKMFSQVWKPGQGPIKVMLYGVIS